MRPHIKLHWPSTAVSTGLPIPRESTIICSSSKLYARAYLTARIDESQTYYEGDVAIDCTDVHPNIELDII